jgi:hypothetical protein
MTDLDREAKFAALPWAAYRDLAQPVAQNPSLDKLLLWLRRGRLFYCREEVLDRELLVHLALHGYRAEHGSFPSSLSALVPNYLTEVPSDPFASEPLHYETTSAGCRVWSVGPDGINDHGQPIPNASWNFALSTGANPPNMGGDIVETLKGN